MQGRFVPLLQYVVVRNHQWPPIKTSMKHYCSRATIGHGDDRRSLLIDPKENHYWKLEGSLDGTNAAQSCGHSSAVPRKATEGVWNVKMSRMTFNKNWHCIIVLWTIMNDDDVMFYVPFFASLIVSLPRGLGMKFVVVATVPVALAGWLAS